MGKKNNSETEDGDSERLRELGFVFTDRLLELGVNFSDIEIALKDPSRMDRVAEIVRGNGVTYQFADEEVESTACYPTEYRPRSIPDQIDRLRELFPELNQGRAVADIEFQVVPLPRGAESYFAIPRWEVIAPTYNEAVERVLAILSSKRNFNNYRNGQLGEERFRQHATTAKIFQKLGSEQKDSDVLVVPAQFSFRHRGHSVRRAREVFKTNEFGLGAFAIGIMLLTHPERLNRHGDLWMDCAGDEFAPDVAGDFLRAPVFGLDDSGVMFDARWLDYASGYCGSVTAFVP